MQVLKDKLTDPRLAKLNAIVLLSLKQKGRAIVNDFNPLSQDKFNELVNFALGNNIGVGFDSCSAFKFIKSIEGRENQKQLEMFADPCESTIYSSYINCRGDFFPCSFAEGDGDWKEGISVLNCNNFPQYLSLFAKIISLPHPFSTFWIFCFVCVCAKNVSE